jgi:hypothetical protein
MARYAEALAAEGQSGLPGYQASIARLGGGDLSGPLVTGRLTWSESAADSALQEARGIKGARMLHALRWVLRNSPLPGESAPEAGEGPDAAFFRVLRALAQTPRHRWGTISTEEFVRFWEESLPLDLHWFFGPWLYGTGRPHLLSDWTSTPAGAGARVHLHLEQVQEDPTYPGGAPYPGSPEDFPMYWQVRLQGPSGQSTDLVVYQSARAQDFTLEAPHPVEALVIDPDHWVGSEIAAFSPPGRALEILSVRPNPSPGPAQIIYRLAQAGFVRMTIHNPSGRAVRHLVREEEMAGIHTLSWNGGTDEGRIAPQGIYFVRIEGGGGADTRKLELLRP